MVFANLSSHEKDAFFALLDEYFASRPELLSSAGAGSNIGLNGDAGRAAAASALHGAFSKTTPQEAASTINSFRKSIPPPAQNPASQAASPDGHAELASSVGRVANMAAAFGAPKSLAPPRPPPRRSPSSEDTSAVSETGKLALQRKFGDVDVSSGKAMFSSLRNSTVAKTATPPPVAPPTPPAFARKGGFAPPPVRRVDSAVSPKAASTPSPPPPPPPPVPVRPREEPEGEWAEVLYDYSSDDPGDLAIQEGQRILIVEKTSDDWWTGECEGRKGLVPAAYVKLL
ncbi:SH3-domain-containing protein [Wolfiporia cocos MD-104 SS10]|uniref:SH3-domain-containing protein n=1 Tax=Wolfiporia cocos (strain MD-104) TaxID=742152 RepID=A0A2H3JRZ6_WOLCO|nr:SH3-domain-containing protein [Wolfiporia cocos MD-104 SS10]